MVQISFGKGDAGEQGRSGVGYPSEALTSVEEEACVVGRCYLYWEG